MKSNKTVELSTEKMKKKKSKKKNEQQKESEHGVKCKYRSFMSSCSLILVKHDSIMVMLKRPLSGFNYLFKKLLYNQKSFKTTASMVQGQRDLSYLLEKAGL